jgi:hypothetical protein
MNRFSNWEALLNDYIASMIHEVHSYGTLDCAMFASGAVLAMTGYDPALEFRGKYKTELGAAKALRQIGNGDLESTFDAKLTPIEAGFAKRGDLVFVDGNVGVCFGAFGLFIDDDGLQRVERNHFLKGWAVG